MLRNPAASMKPAPRAMKYLRTTSFHSRRATTTRPPRTLAAAAAPPRSRLHCRALMVAKARTIHRFDGPGHGRYSDALVRRRPRGAWAYVSVAMLLSATAAAFPQAPPAPLPSPAEAPLQAPPEPGAEAAAEPSAERVLDEAVGPAPGATTMSLAQAVTTALQGNFSLLDTTDALSSARYNYSASLADFYPKLTPRVSRGQDLSVVGFDASQAVPWTGGTLTASGNYRMFEAAEGPFNRSSSFSFTLSQPL